MRTADVSGIKLQGRNDAAHWLTGFKVQYSLDYETWSFAKNEHENELFVGNTGQFQTRENMFSDKVKARYVRVIVDTWHGFPCMRFELLGCYTSRDCAIGQFKNSTITTSSDLSVKNTAQYAYLDAVA